jgi:uncharacterized protein with NRDE domain
MCLVLVAWQQDDALPLIVAGNRDEFHARLTEPLHWWSDKPQILAGRDLEAGGTWLAMGRNGRFATVTNFRDADHPQARFRSRGELVTGFIESAAGPLEYLQSIDGAHYAGFNLLVSDGERLAYASNRDGGRARELAPGLYGVANGGLDAPWHKTLVSKERMRQALSEGVDTDGLLALLDDRERGPDDDVSAAVPGFAGAGALTAPFIVLPDYGTRSSTAVLLSNTGRVDVTERRFGPDGLQTGETRETFQPA